MIELSIGVACEVDDDTLACGLLLETMDRHDREDLFDGPGIRRRLKDREISEIGVGQDLA